MSKIKSLVLSLRPKQWTKNLFIYIALFFSGKFLQAESILRVSQCFFYFCLLSSVVYILNDIIDRQEDQQHPVKSQRPIARGKISALAMFVASVVLLVFSLTGIRGLSSSSLMMIVVSYLFLNIFYSFFLKHRVILDVIAIALGFELRIWAGAVVISVVPSVWLQVYTFLVALFLGFTKRRAEVMLLRAEAIRHRKVLVHYRLLFLDQLISICAGVIILAYALYTLSAEVLSRPGGRYLIYTTPLVVYGVFRCLYLIYMQKKGADPTEMIFSDFPLFATLLLWFASILLILYLPQL